MENAENNSNSSNSKALSIVLIVLLVAVGAIGIYLGYSNQQLKRELADCGYVKEEVTREKEQVVGELENMLLRYDSLQTDNDSINGELLAERSKVEQLLQEAKNNKWTIYKLRKEASTLRTIMKGYVRSIDSLNTLNVELRAENASVNRKLTESESQNEALRETNTELEGKVRLGAKLKALDMIAYGQRVKRNNVHRETNRAEKVEKVKVCFTLDKNEVAESGSKKIYVRLITPSGKVLSERTDESNMFQFEGRKGLFSMKKVVEYEKQELDLCMYWEVASSLSEGEYLVEAYADGMKIGNTSFTLK